MTSPFADMEKLVRTYLSSPDKFRVTGYDMITNYQLQEVAILHPES